MDYESLLLTSCDRRSFLESCMKGTCALGLGSMMMGQSELFASLDSAGELLSAQPSGSEERFVKQARHYKKFGNNLVRCNLCPHHCPVPDGGRGLCNVRENRRGTYYTLVYSRICAIHIDPIEKKPLFHYKPGTNALSIATPGCNFSCKFCQNWQISQSRPEDINCRYFSPQDIVSRAVNAKTPTIAYTYSEPTIFYEYMYDTAKLGNEHGVKSVAITNGFMEQQAQDELLDHLDGIKVDLKSFTEKFYNQICSGSLKGVKDSLKRIRARDKWLEIVVLIIPTLNDSAQEITEMAKWIAGELGCDVPVHFSRFHPQYKLKNLPATPISTLERCIDICKQQGLKYTYLGNTPGHSAENTYCPSCGKPIIKRYGFYVLSNKIKNGKCTFCGSTVAGVF